MSLNTKDLAQLKSKGITLEQLERQLASFKKGFPFIKLVGSATPTNGIRIVNTDHKAKKHSAEGIKFQKFVPASGAASRMFKHLFEFKDALSNGNILSEYLKDPKHKLAKQFVENFSEFAFYQELESVMKDDGLSLGEAIANNEWELILNYILTEKGLNYAQTPKALIKFHHYNHIQAYAFEEHLKEGLAYAAGDDGKVSIHFTVSPEHRPKFEAEVKKSIELMQAKTNVQFEISFSEQKSSTDTVAVSPDNEVFREKDGTMLFRPGGHGALIENLNDLEADIIFVKNIDNVVPDYHMQDTTYYKNALKEVLLEKREKIFQYLDRLSAQPDSVDFPALFDFCKTDLLLDLDENILGMDKENQTKYFIDLLNRPIRVCGMVKNVGEPGGGPFWVENEEGKVSLQVVESAQIDLKDEQQEKFFNSSTHFNPVDLICCIRNHRAEKWNLLDFVDEKTGFISNKSKDGKDLKAMELPGLWNGAMAHWITLFVEVPLSTFNPVKTVNDLLREMHQPI